MNKNLVNFKELKERVSIEDVAYSLGYRIDKKAGIGRYIEMVLGDEMQKKDTLIIRNTRDKGSQTFFRRDGSKGDVVSLIKENINSFHASGKNDWEKIARVLSDFANMPMPEYKEEYKEKMNNPAQVFEANRYEVKKIDETDIPYLFRKRGIYADTVKAFGDNISLIRDKNNQAFNGFNIGFPYREGGSEEIAGYEIRGHNGYKSKASGTNSSSAAWIVDFTDGNPNKARNVFFAESAFDIMSFYQRNKFKIDRDSSVFVSLGGTFSDKQVLGIMSHFKEARAYDCFDNDLAGHVYGIRMACLLENIPLNITKKEDGLEIKANGKTFHLATADVSLKGFREHVNMRYRVGTWHAPQNFKDWNDCVMNKPMIRTPTPSILDRDEALAEKRNGGIKI